MTAAQFPQCAGRGARTPHEPRCRQLRIEVAFPPQWDYWQSIVIERTCWLWWRYLVRTGRLPDAVDPLDIVQVLELRMSMADGPYDYDTDGSIELTAALL